jgi:hypothetical protein
MTATAARLYLTGIRRIRQALVNLRFYQIRCAGVSSNVYWKWHLAAFEHKLAHRLSKNTNQGRSVFKVIRHLRFIYYTVKFGAFNNIIRYSLGQNRERW